VVGKKNLRPSKRPEPGPKNRVAGQDRGPPPAPVLASRLDSFGAMRSSDYQPNRRSASQVRPLSSPAGLPPNQESPPRGAERRGMEEDGQRALCPVEVIRRGSGGGRRRSQCVHPSSNSAPANPTRLHGRTRPASQLLQSWPPALIPGRKGCRGHRRYGQPRSRHQRMSRASPVWATSIQAPTVAVGREWPPPRNVFLAPAGPALHRERGWAERAPREGAAVVGASLGHSGLGGEGAPGCAGLGRGGDRAR
jgi:hypothetical protein